MNEKKIIPYHEFKDLDREKKKALLIEYEKEMSSAKLAKEWGIHVSNVYQFRSQLGVSKPYKPKNNKNDKPEEKQEQPPNRLDEALHTTLSAFKPQNTQVVKKVEPVLKIENIENKIDNVYNALKSEIQRLNFQHEPEDASGITFKFQGKFTSKQLTKKLEKVLLIIDDENAEFEVDFKLKEREQKKVIEVEHEEDSVEENKIEDLKKEFKEELIDVVDSLNKDLKALQEELNKKTELEQKFAEGYNTLKNDKQGLHKPKSEFESVKKKQLRKA